MQDRVRYSGVIEVPGLPTRPKLRTAAPITPDDASATPTPDAGGRDRNSGAKLDKDGAFALASASLRQALQDMPELAEVSKQVMIEQSPNGLNIEIVDQDGRSMFAEGAKEPYERTRGIIEKLAGPLKATPYRIAITGHTSASKTPSRAEYGPWNLSADRANAVRQILEESGMPSANFYAVAGKADTDPLFPDDPFIAANRKAEVFLSIHHDSVNTKYMDYWYHNGRKLQFSDVFRGFSLFIFGGPMYFEQSFKLATEIGENLTSRGLKPTLHHAEPIPGESRPLINRDLGIYTAPFAVLRYATVPAVLFEVGVIANRQEEHDLEDRAYRSKAEEAILHSLEEYCRMA